MDDEPTVRITPSYSENPDAFLTSPTSPGKSFEELTRTTGMGGDKAWRKVQQQQARRAQPRAKLLDRDDWKTVTILMFAFALAAFFGGFFGYLAAQWAGQM